MAARDTSRARAAAHATRVVGRETMGEDAFARPSSREHGLEEVEVRRAGKAPRLLQAQSIEFVNTTNISPRLARNGHAFVSARSAGTRRKHLSPWRRIGLLNVAFLSSPTPPPRPAAPGIISLALQLSLQAARSGVERRTWGHHSVMLAGFPVPLLSLLFSLVAFISHTSAAPTDRE